MGKLLHEKLSYNIRGTIFRVYNSLGPGFREEVYKQAAKHDLLKAGLPIEVEKHIPIPYENDPAIDTYRLDILLDNKIILELKAVAEIHERFVAQTLSELLASKIEIESFIKIYATRCMAASIKYIIRSGRDIASQLMKKRC